MTYFTCKINMDNEAFENPEHLRELLLEIAEETRFHSEGDLGEKIISAKTTMPIFDSNGNKVGEWVLKKTKHS